MHLKDNPLVEEQLDAAARTCAQQGAQLTELRRLVLGLILGSDGPLTAYQLLDRLKEIRKHAAPPTIYRALDFLLHQRLIHRVERLNAFIPCTDPRPHDHAVQFLICRRCGSVAEIEDGAIAQAVTRAAEHHGFRPGHAVIEIDGTCAACADRP